MLKWPANLLLGFWVLVGCLSAGSVRAQSIVPAADGTGTLIQQNGNIYQIEGGTQAGANLFHSFQQLGLQPHEIAEFLSQAGIENILGRVTGGSPSLIEGLLRVSGSEANFYLINPAGIVFGQGASLDLQGSFIATTADAIGVGEYFFNATGPNSYPALAGQPNSFVFGSATPGSLINAANLSVSEGEMLGLLGGTVINTGDLAAPGGQIAIAAVPGETLVQINQQGMVLGLDVAPSSFLNGAETATLQAIDLPTLLTDPAIQHATGVRVDGNGELHLSGARLQLPDAAGTTLISGQLDVSNASTNATLHTPHSTPHIDILGDRVALLDAHLDASGIGGGGLVRVGGNYQGQGTLPTASQVFVSQDSTIKVNAIDWGDGGRAIVWADEATTFYGGVSARGGAMAGNGGFVEVSGYKDLHFRGQVDMGAPHGSHGTLLLDPTDIVITAGGATGGFSGTPSGGTGQVLFSDTGPTTITQNQLQDASLANVDILLQATNSITINPLSGNVLDFPSGTGSISFQAGGDFSMSTADTIRTNGRDLSISAANITAGTLDAAVVEDVILFGIINVMGGDVTLAATGDLSVGDIDASGTVRAVLGSRTATGGNVSLTATTGDLSAGNISTLASGTLATDGTVMATAGTLDLTAGGAIATGNLAATAAGRATGLGSGTATSSAINIQAGGAISTGTILTTSMATAGEGPAVATADAIALNSGSSISVTAVDATASTSNSIAGESTARSGAVTFNSNGTLSTTTINTSASAADTGAVNTVIANAGAVTLNSGSTAGSNIQFVRINTSASATSNPAFATGSGGAVSILATGTVQGTGMGTTIDTSGTTSGGSVAIQHDGGPNNVAFTLGDAGQNGLAGAINTGSNSLTSGTFAVQASGGSDMPISDITFTSINAAPTIATNAVLAGATLNTAFPFTLADLVTDVNADVLQITIVQINAGILALASNPLVPLAAGDIVTVNDSLIYTPPTGVTGTINAFVLQASDGVALSDPAQVQIAVSAASPAAETGTRDEDTLPRERAIAAAAGIEADAPSCGLVDGGVGARDRSYTREFESYLGISQGDPQSATDACQTLQAASGETGTIPALIYVGFVPQLSSLNLTSTAPAGATTTFLPQANIKSLENHARDSFGTDRLAGGDRQSDPPPLNSQRPLHTLQQTRLIRKLEWKPTGGGLPLQFSDKSNNHARDDDRLDLVIVTPAGIFYQQVPEATRSRVEAASRLLARRVTDPIGLNTALYLPPAQQLYQWLVAPIEAKLQAQGIENLVFIMDAGLRSLPLAALHDGERFIIERYSLGLMPSLSLTDIRKRNLQATQVLAMGASTFSDQSPLPAVPVELAAITGQLWAGQSFLNQEFTPQRLRQIHKSQPFGIVHLATHAEFRPGNADKSYIQFSNQQINLQDLRQLLTDSPVDLLVLSACRTALGDPEAELGFAGLAVQTGARAALGSLWYVSDEGTLGLMTSFYEQLRQAPSKAEALRQAQLALLRGEVRLENGQLVTPTAQFPLPPELAALGDRPLNHPFYWSAFTMIGNPW